MKNTMKFLSLVSAALLLTACNDTTSPAAGADTNKSSAENAKDKVVIKSYDSYPTALGCETAGAGVMDRSDCFVLANGTLGEVVEWHKNYTTHVPRPFAQRDMFAESKIKITSGPLKGKTLFVAHAYINMQ